MKETFKYILLIVCLLQHPNAFSQSSDMSGIIDTLGKSPPAPFESALSQFVQAAQNGDVETMLNITSPTTRNYNGEEALKKKYLEEYVPLLSQFSNLSVGGSNTYIKDGYGNEGWAFDKSLKATDGKSIGIKVVTIRQNGKPYIWSFNFVK